MGDGRVSVVTPCFRGERYLQRFLESVREQTIFDHLEVVFVHNDPTEAELAMVSEFQRSHAGHLVHIVVPEVEGVYSSLNRALAEARAPYVAYWGVDDLRTANSLELQAEALDAAPSATVAYGDYTVVSSVWAREGHPIVLPERFTLEGFTRAMHVGSFPMWRARWQRVAGPFDEQFHRSGDWDLMIRLAFHGPMVKAKGHLGYFLNEGTGLSTRGDLLPTIEQNVISLRYGIYDKVDYRHYRATVRYTIGSILAGGQWTRVDRFVPDYAAFLRRRRWRILFGLLRSMALVPYRGLRLYRLRSRLARIGG